jgi:hypothetical protein
MMAIGRLFFGTTTSMANNRRRSHLVRSVIALAAGSVLLAGTAARAQSVVLATGGVFGGVNQNYAVCYAFNAGTTKVPAVTVVVRDQNGGITARTLCAVNPGAMCAVQAGLVSTVAYSCTITGAGASAANLRGVLDIRDVNSNVLINSNLR